MKKILFGLIACAALCACSDDVVVGTGNSSPITLDGNDVYLTVRLNDVGSATRATDGGLAYGSEAEHTVTNAYFYFYDEDGLFVSRAEVWDGGEAVTDEPVGNVEFKSNTVIVLKGLTDTKFPRYMVTVLNEPENFESGDYSAYYDPAGTLDEFQTKLAHASEVGIYDNSGNFVMSTSAYNAPTYTGQYAADGESDVSPWYFVTPINEDNFSLEPIGSTTETNPIEVYVERLAAKVEVGVSEALVATEMEDGDGNTHNVYSLEETIAGDANGDGTYDASEKEGTDHLYVEFLGWALNGTARYSNIVKDITGLDAEEGITTSNIDATPASVTWAATDWNDADNFRSYWGKSFNYGIDHTYPTTSTRYGAEAANTDDDEESSDTWLDDYLKYTSLLDGNLHELSLDNSDPEYCAENTNDPTILLNKRNSGITNALLKAQIWSYTTNPETGEETLTAGNIIRFEGELFTESAFQQYIAQRVGIDTRLSSCCWTSNVSTQGGMVGVPALDNGQARTQAELEDAGVNFSTLEYLSYDMLQLVDMGNGLLYIELDLGALEFEMESSLFWEMSTDEETGETLYTLVDNEDVEADFAAVEAYLEEMLEEGYEINGYAGGLMYYAIPIEHLNDDIPEYDEPMPEGELLIAEGNYGVLRNHWYQLSITGLSNVGKGIWNEAEVIIPDPTDPVYYYVEADMNILSWKMVQQDVDL